MYFECCINLFFNYLKFYTVCFFSCLTEKRRPEPLTALRRMPGIGEVQQSMTVVRQCIALIITVRMSHRTSIERWACVCQSSRKNITTCTLTVMAVNDELERTRKEEISGLLWTPFLGFFRKWQRKPPQKIPNKYIMCPVGNSNWSLSE